MSHVDDGMLHAYLDGGLSALDAVRVERHVAECGSCQQRLDTARGLIQRAARLLEWASPPAERAAPPLAALRPVVVPRWRVPVAWAATIVLALGAGIYGGQILLSPRAAQDKFASSAREAEADRRARSLMVPTDSPPAREGAAPATVPAAVTQAPAPANTAAVGEARLYDAAAKARVDSNAAVALNRSRQEAQAQAPAAGVAAAAPPAARDTAKPSANQVAGQRLDEAVVTAAAPTPAAADSAAAGRIRAYAPPTAGAEPQARRAVGAPLSTTWPVITRDSASRLLRTPLVLLPDLPVAAVRATADGVIVEHVLPPGQVIRLIERRVAEGESPPPTGDLLARYLGGLRVEISGPLTPDSLSRLLERARVVP